jgi:hypothetical protein
VFALKKANLMPLVNVVADLLPTWKANLMNNVGCTTLTKVTISDIPIHVSIAMVVSPWIYNAINRVHRSFV